MPAIEIKTTEYAQDYAAKYLAFAIILAIIAERINDNKFAE